MMITAHEHVPMLTSQRDSLMHWVDGLYRFNIFTVQCDVIISSLNKNSQIISTTLSRYVFAPQTQLGEKPKCVLNTPCLYKSSV